MRKLSLNPDELAVQSFPTASPTDERGTVHGLTGDQDTCVAANTCAPGCTRQDTCSTCVQSCGATCVTCPATCGCLSADGRC
jgi:hypothetical protein